MATTKSNINYKYILINEGTGERIKVSRTIKALKDYLIISLYPTGTKFIIEREVYQGKYLLGVYMNYKGYVIG